MDGFIIGTDVYLRYGRGPVQQFRAWDKERFIESQVDQGLAAKEPYVVAVCTREEYLLEHRK
jgi:hypothetical protein